MRVAGDLTQVVSIANPNAEESGSPRCRQLSWCKVLSPRAVRQNEVFELATKVTHTSSIPGLANRFQTSSVPLCWQMTHRQQTQ